MGNSYNCYYHCNDHSRHAVATCSKCGKAICKECANLVYGDNGPAVCPACREKEFKDTLAMHKKASNTVTKELVLIVLGFVIGMIIKSVVDFRSLLGNETMADIISFFLPFITASLTTLVKFLISKSFGYFTFFILFFALFFFSPIILIVRIVKRIKHIVQLIKSKKNLNAWIKYTNEYIEKAKTIQGVDYDERIRQEQAKVAALEAEKNSLKEQCEQLQKSDIMDETSKREHASLENMLNAVMAQMSERITVLSNMQEEQRKAENKRNADIEDMRKQVNANSANIGDMRKQLNNIASA